MVQEFDTDNSGTISMDEFVLAVQLYAARSVTDGDDDPYTCLFIDYGPKFSKRTLVLPFVCQILSGCNVKSVKAACLTDRAGTTAFVCKVLQGHLRISAPISNGSIRNLRDVRLGRRCI